MEKYHPYLTAGEKNNLGICLWDAKYFEEAAQLFVEAVNENPENEATVDMLLGIWVESQYHILGWDLRDRICQTLKPFGMDPIKFTLLRNRIESNSIGILINDNAFLSDSF